MKKNDIKKLNLKHLGIVIILLVLYAILEYLMPTNETELTNNTQINTTSETKEYIGINDIPEYSGQIVITINDDIPYFEEKDMVTEDFEYYSPLDEYDRAGQAFANICKYTMPEERN